MRNVGFDGYGEMGEKMAGHVIKAGAFEVWTFHVREGSRAGQPWTG